LCFFFVMIVEKKQKKNTHKTVSVVTGALMSNSLALWVGVCLLVSSSLCFKPSRGKLPQEPIFQTEEASVGDRQGPQ